MHTCICMAILSKLVSQRRRHEHDACDGMRAKWICRQRRRRHFVLVAAAALSLAPAPLMLWTEWAALLREEAKLTIHSLLHAVPLVMEY